MAKYCDVCKQSYPDDKLLCPHCHPAGEQGADDAADIVDLDALDSSSPGEIGEAVPPDQQSPSGVSNVVWAALVEDESDEVPLDQLPRVDAPSDQDIIRLAHPDEALAPGSGPTPPEDQGPVDLVEEASGIHLGELGPAQDFPISDLHLAKETLEDDLAQVEAESMINLGDTSEPPQDLAGRDLIAEAVESGVDLTGEAEADQDSSLDALREEEKTGSADQLSPDLRAGVPAGEESLIVDLDKMTSREEPEIPMGELGEEVSADFLKKGEAPEEKAKVQEKPEEEEEEAPLNLGEGEPEIVEEEEEEEEEEDKGRERVKKDRSRSGTGLAWVGGGLIGAVAGAGACIALAFLGLLPGSQTGKTPAPTTEPMTVARVGPPSYDDAVAAFRHGDYAQALPGLEAVPEPTPEILAQRGAARWLQYLQQQKEKNAALKTDDNLVKQASEDLTKAAESNAEALFYLAQMKELTGQAKEAQQEYQRGLKIFQADPVWRSRFQTALDRLAVQGTSSKPAGQVGWRSAPRRDAVQHLAMLLTALQAEAPAAPAAETEEAGTHFWKAVKLAQEGKFDEARKALDQARKVHDQERFRRSQGPEPLQRSDRKHLSGVL